MLLLMKGWDGYGKSRDITGRELTPDDFLDYLEEKYSKLYEL